MCTVYLLPTSLGKGNSEQGLAKFVFLRFSMFFLRFSMIFFCIFSQNNKFCAKIGENLNENVFIFNFRFLRFSRFFFAFRKTKNNSSSPDPILDSKIINFSFWRISILFFLSLAKSAAVARCPRWRRSAATH